LRPAADLGQRRLPALVVELLEAVDAVVVELLEAVDAVPAVAEHRAGLADIAELTGEFQQPDLGADDLLLLCPLRCSCVLSGFSVPPVGGPRSEHRGKDRAPPTGSILREPTQTVRSSPS
jgi:hypothetical protein